MFKLIKESCSGGEKTSSKRIIMYLFAFVAMFMIGVQASATIIALWKWTHGGTECEVFSVFPDTVWYMVFGLIGGLAGVNGTVDSVKAYKAKKVAQEPLNEELG